MGTIDANTKGGSLDSGTSFKEKMNTNPKSAGMDRGNGMGDQKVPKRPSEKKGNGITFK